MKVLIANTVEETGGAAKAAKRLFESLNVDKNYLVQVKNSRDERVIGPSHISEKLTAKIRSFADRSLTKVFYRPKGLFSRSDFSFEYISSHVRELNPDIVNLHWVQAGMFSLNELKKINRPIVWTLHDSWLFTGGCHLPFECKRYINECGNCPVLGSTTENDLSHKILKFKLEVIKNRGDVFVCPSQWLKNKALESSLLRNEKIVVIKNVLDNKLFRPSQKEFCRQTLSIPDGVKVILFGANHALSDSNKGFQFIREASDKMKNRDDLFFVFYGANKPENFSFSHRYKFLGNVKDELQMSTLYNAADLTCVPSKSENLSYTIMESLYCSTPVLAFDVGGNKELISHKFNGYLAHPYEIDDYVSGFTYLLDKKLSFSYSQNSSRDYLELFTGLMK